jgi:hypothetical protein
MKAAWTKLSTKKTGRESFPVFLFQKRHINLDKDPPKEEPFYEKQSTSVFFDF